MAVKHLTTEEFYKQVADLEKNPQEFKFLGDKPAIIDFYASWCGPCKALSPILEDIAQEFDGKIDIFKVDTEAEQVLAASFGIRSIPSLLFVPMSGQPQMAQGLMQKSQLREAINGVLLK